MSSGNSLRPRKGIAGSEFSPCCTSGCGLSHKCLHRGDLFLDYGRKGVIEGYLLLCLWGCKPAQGASIPGCRVGEVGSLWCSDTQLASGKRQQPVHTQTHCGSVCTPQGLRRYSCGAVAHPLDSSLGLSLKLPHWDCRPLQGLVVLQGPHLLLSRCFLRGCPLYV